DWRAPECSQGCEKSEAVHLTSPVCQSPACAIARRVSSPRAAKIARVAFTAALLGGWSLGGGGSGAPLRDNGAVCGAAGTASRAIGAPTDLADALSPGATQHVTKPRTPH